MCRWLAYRGNPLFIEQLVFEPEHSLVEQSQSARKAKVAINGDGFGLGWYGGRAFPGLYHEILPAWNDSNLRNVAEQIESNLFFAHVRASTGTSTSRENCHPFRWRQHLFMHNGQVGGYTRIRRKLESMVSDEMYPCRLGSTDSELIFMLLIQNGMEGDFPKAVKDTIHQLRSVMSDSDIDEPLRLTAAWSDGASLAAVRYASDKYAPSLFWREDREGLVVVSEPLDDDLKTWRKVPHGHLLVASFNQPAGISALDL